MKRWVEYIHLSHRHTGKQGCLKKVHWLDHCRPLLLQHWGRTIEERSTPGISRQCDRQLHCWKVFNNGAIASLQYSQGNNCCWPTGAINCRPCMYQAKKLNLPMKSQSGYCRPLTVTSRWLREKVWNHIPEKFLFSDHQRGSAGRNWEGEGCASSGCLSFRLCTDILAIYVNPLFSVQRHPGVIWECTDQQEW